MRRQPTGRGRAAGEGASCEHGSTMTSRNLPVALVFLALVAVTSCASGGGSDVKAPAPPAGPPPATVPAADPKEVVRAFWVALAQRDVARVAELASFPFDLDGHNGCV